MTGKVKDVALNYFLSSATVSLLNSDSTLVSLQITDAYGVFNFSKIKRSVPHHIIISSVGYRSKVIDLKPDKNKDFLDLGTVIMEATTIGLKEVSIGVEPVTMNGDTLEFNSSAFKLDSNAVLDDWLRKIPNVTVWNDGQITVNGREIKSLLVNGKNFFGSDFKIATQNLPKNVIQTIQVYKKDENKLNPLDSTMEMNIKLKKGLNSGFFGKISAGGGTNGRYEGEGNVNGYTKKIQISLAAAANNTNKIANDLQTLLANSTFKSGRTDLSYQSNFMLPGDNKTNTLGVNFKYDFVEFPTFDNKNTLSISQFYQKRISYQTALIDAITNRNTQDAIFQKSSENAESNKASNTTTLNYDFVKYENSVSLQSSFANLSDDINSQSRVKSINSQGDMVSASNADYLQNSTQKEFSLFLRYAYSPSSFDHKMKKWKMEPFYITYSNNHINTNSFSNLKTSFLSDIDGSAANFDRNRSFEEDLSDQKIDLKVDNILKLLSGKETYFIRADFLNSVKLEQATRTDFVQDKQNDVYVDNKYLSNKTKRKILNSLYGINLSKSFGKRLTDRFDRNLAFNFGGSFNAIKYDNTSLKQFQNLQRNYLSFIPNASVQWFDNVFGKRKISAGVEMKVDINIPQLEQLAPLPDSTRFYYLRIGNPRVTAEKIQQIALSYSYEDLNTKNTFAYDLKGEIKFSNNKIIDSVFLTPDGRQLVYATNGPSYRSFNGSFEIRKAVKFNYADLKFQAFGNLSKDFIPNFVNNQFVINQNLATNIGVSAGYGFKDMIVFDLRENISYYQFKQPYFDAAFNGTTFTHTLSMNYKVSKKMFFNTNINFNDNRSSGINPNVFTIWNAYLSKRFLKRDNCELKFSALDILRQNKNLINRIEANRFITSSRNALQQYFLVSLSYYPRNFGKKR
ncbi:outer membrane beta-barrel protein [uncultured Mucilaginibacter sp.]|uniref:outer membrane beta-barrel protein n=1 Tax=uncultured Mucilaginibacter sp. TaxID=797541 RepID=UPI002604743C|nr:outer membrane beta-barrel protein [uncultured Mucilaginibacter sp.]